jgi:hypothetical protein
VNEPQVRLHDVSIEGDVGERETLLAAVERAVARATSEGTAPGPAVASAVRSVVAGRALDGSRARHGSTTTSEGD